MTEPKIVHSLQVVAFNKEKNGKRFFRGTLIRSFEKCCRLKEGEEETR
jgi:hypothetical protein